MTKQELGGNLRICVLNLFPWLNSAKVTDHKSYNGGNKNNNLTLVIRSKDLDALRMEVSNM